MRILTAVAPLLEKHDLLEPWPIKVQVEAGVEPRKLDGLYRISEARLNAVSADTLLELRDSGSLVLAYSQLFSIQNLAQLGKLASAHAAADKKLAMQANAGLGLVSESGTISFDNL